jgi:hypothetical protein
MGKARLRRQMLPVLLATAGVMLLVPLPVSGQESVLPAVFAGNPSDSLAVSWSGSNGSVIGLTHSNAGIRFTGSGNSLTGGVGYVTSFQNLGANNSFDPAPAQTAQQPFPMSVEVASFQPGGSKADAAGVDFHDMSNLCSQQGTFTISAPSLAAGLYWVPCKITISASNLTATVTIVSTGQVTLSGSGHNLTPFVDNLAFYTTSTSSSAVTISGSNSTYQGAIVAPQGRIRVTGGNDIFDCGLLAHRILISGSGADIAGCVIEEPAPAPEVVHIVTPGEGELVFAITQVAVAVSPEGAVGTVDLLIDGQIVDTSPISSGSAGLSWDTTTFDDGQRLIEVQARDASGQVSATASVTVEVVNGFDTAGRLVADFEAGRIDVTDYVELGLTGLLMPELLPARYQTEPTESDDESNGLVIEYLQYWSQLDQPTQERLGAAIEAARVLDFAYVTELLGGSVPEGPQGFATLQASSPWPECVETPSGVAGFPDYLLCTHDTGGFVITYQLPQGLFPANGVAEVDDYHRVGTLVIPCDETCKQASGYVAVPDYVDRVAAALEHGWNIYQGLGFDMPPLPVKVTIMKARAHVYPTSLQLGVIEVGWKPTIVVNNRNDQFSTPRHELFHMVQYEYVGVNQIAGGPGVWAWLEATANWAAHQAVRPSDNVGIPDTEQDSPYYLRIGAVLSRSNWWALTFEDVIPLANPYRSQQRQYGTFILAEHLDQHLDPPDTDTTIIERTWQLIDAGADAPTAIEQVVDEQDWNLADQLADYHVDSFILTAQEGLGFTDPDAALWEDQLNAPPEGSGIDALPDRRPKTTDHDFDSVGDVWDPTDDERPFLVAGGAVYLAIDLLDSEGDPIVADLEVEVPAIDEVAVSLLLFDGYPNLCAVQPPSIRIDGGPGTAAEATVPLSGACDEAVVVISHTGLVPGPVGSLEPGWPGFGPFRNGVQVDWEASLSPESGSPTNLDFETGDLTGWVIVDSGDPGTQYDVITPGLDGTNYAFLLQSTGQPIDGIQQSIDWQYANCSVQALADGTGGTTVALRVLRPDGSIWGEHQYTFTGSEADPVELFVGNGPTFYLPDPFTIQLLYLAGTGGVEAVFDEVVIGDCT